jgi:hypothetical protein
VVTKDTPAKSEKGLELEYSKLKLVIPSDVTSANAKLSSGTFNLWSNALTTTFVPAGVKPVTAQPAQSSFGPDTKSYSSVFLL